MRVISDKVKAKRMIFILFLLFICVFFSLFAKVMYIIFNNNKSYEKQVVAQHIKNKTYSETIESRRGSITDRNGITLAESIKIYNVIYDCHFINALEDEEVDEINTLLGDYLSEWTKKELEQLLIDFPDSSYKILLRNKEYDEIKHLIDASDTGEVKGIGFEPRYKRVYPYDVLACDVIGYANQTEGVFGTEYYYDDILRGEDGRLFGTIDDEVMVKQNEIEPTNGMDIELTIDFTLQKYTEEVITKYYEAREMKSINAIIMDPNNGEILAMASYPNYNLNTPYDFSAFLEQEEIAAMEPRELNNYRESMWQNFLVNSTYEPGSTYKPFTLAAALEEDIITLEDEYECKGYKVVYDRVIHCWKGIGHGKLTAKEALAGSCNVVFMDIGEQMGKDIYYEYNKNFGFMDKTNIDIPGEAKGIPFPYDVIGPTELATGSFGQGPTITPLQLMAGFSALVNGGDLYQPYLMKKVIDDDGHIRMRNDQLLVRQVISEETSDEISHALLDVVKSGTGKP